MRLLKHFQIIEFIFITCFWCILILFQPVRILRHISQLHIPRKDPGPLPEVIVVLQVNEATDQLLLSLGSCFALVDEINDDVFIKSTIIGIDSAIQLWSMLDPVIINIKDLFFELLPLLYLELFNHCRVSFHLLNAILAESYDSIWNSPEIISWVGDLGCVKIWFKHLLAFDS